MKSKNKKDVKHKLNTVISIAGTNETVKLPKGVIPTKGSNIFLENDSHLYEVVNVTFSIGTKETLVNVQIEKC